MWVYVVEVRDVAALDTQKDQQHEIQITDRNDSNERERERERESEEGRSQEIEGTHAHS